MKNKILAAALVGCLIAVLSVGSLAWFTDTDGSTNTFYVADSDDDADDVFSVDVKEDVKQDGKTEETGVDGYTFEDLLPGETVKKAPYVKNTSETHAQYIRVTVTVSNAAEIKAASGLDDISKLVGGFNATDLVEDSRTYDDAANAMVYTYYVNKIVAAQESVQLFETVSIPEDLTREQAALWKGFTMNIKAEAVQTEYVLNPYTGDVVAAAKASFAAVGM